MYVYMYTCTGMYVYMYRYVCIHVQVCMYVYVTNKIFCNDAIGRGRWIPLQAQHGNVRHSRQSSRCRGYYIIKE